MDDGLDPDVVAAALLASISALVRRIRQVPTPGELTMPERTALSLLDRRGPTTSSALAREVQITAQAMGATISGLRARGLVDRSPDSVDGRRVVLTVTEDGLQALKNKRNARNELVAQALTSGMYTPAELKQLAAAAPLLKRLAQHV